MPADQPTNDGHPTRDYILVATSDGLTVHTGPIDLGRALLTVDEYLLPNGWTHRFIPLTPLDDAVRCFTAANVPPRPAAAADLFVALRRAIVTDPTMDGPDDERVGQLLAHVDPHRPAQLWTGDEECLLGECDHPGDGPCPGLERADVLCVACTPMFDPGGDWGANPIAACRVPWPCSVVITVAAHYAVPIGEKVAA